MSTKVLTLLGNVWEALFDPKVKATVCGHLTRETDKLAAFGKVKEFRLPIKKGKTPYCHKCLSKMAIRCAYCGNPIHIGDMVIIGPAVDQGNMFDQYTAFYKGSKIYVVCTDRASCVEVAGIAEAGIWVAPGRIQLISERGMSR